LQLPAGAERVAIVEPCLLLALPETLA